MRRQNEAITGRGQRDKQKKKHCHFCTGTTHRPVSATRLHCFANEGNWNYSNIFVCLFSPFFLTIITNYCLPLKDAAAGAAGSARVLVGCRELLVDVE